MLLLAVESATETAAVALIDDEGALGSAVLARGRRHTETIVPAIETLCRRVGVAPVDLHALAVDVGPGLFTGLRVGVGTVKALSFALDIPVATASSLEVLAHAVAGSGATEGRLLVPVVDARRGEVFSARFRSTEGTVVPWPGTDRVSPENERSENERLWAPEDLAADLARLGEPLVLIGNGARRYAALLTAVPGVSLAGPAYASPPVTALAELGLARARAGEAHDGDDVMPRYLRQVDARINWEKRIAPRPDPVPEVSP